MGLKVIRTPRLGLLWISLFLLSSAHAAVFTVDYGSEWVKVVVVSPRLKPDPIAIAINEMSKRKSPALVAISNGDRLVSEEAAGIAARYPDRVYSRARDLVGVPLDAARAMLLRNHLSYRIAGGPEGGDAPAVAEGEGKVWVRTQDGASSYMAEEVVGMLLEYARHLAQSHAKFEVVDAVVSIPPFFSQSQRQGILDAAALVGLNVMALVHEHSGTALQYGMFRSNKELEGGRIVLLYDMGATSTYAAVLHFSLFTVTERGKNVTNPQFQVKGVRWDQDLGGQSLELRLLDHFADEFNAKVGGGVDVRKLPKAMAKLRKEVKRTKEVLSANSEAPISVESLHDEMDFRSSISRDKFEELCADLWPRAVLPLQQVLADTGLSVADVHAVELVGGGTRVPKIQAVLQAFIGPNRTLDRHLDADESVALGSAWLAANLSDGFKLNRRVGMVDGTPYGVMYRVRGLPSATGGAASAVAEAEDLLFPRLKKFPLKIVRSLKEHAADDFELSLLYDEAQGLPPNWQPGAPFLTYHVLGARNSTERYSKYNLTGPLKTTLHFELSRSAMATLERAEVVVEFSEWVETRVPIIPPLANATSANATNATASEKDSIPSNGGAKEEEGAKEEGGGVAEAEKGGKNSTDGGAEAAPVETVEYEVKRRLRKRTIRVPLELVDMTPGFQRRLTAAEINAGEGRIEALRRREAEKKATEEAKNALEAYIYSTKDKMENEDEALSGVSTSEQRDAIRSQLLDAEDWLYMDGEHATAAEFKSKLASIRKDADAMFFRLKELDDRPAAVARAHIFLETTRDVLDAWKDDKPWINQTSMVAPLREDLDELQRWLDEKEAEQKKTAPHEEAAFTSRTVVNRLNSIQDRVSRIERIPKPKPPPPKKAPPPKPGSQSAPNGTSGAAGNKTVIEDETEKTSGGEKDLHDEL